MTMISNDTMKALGNDFLTQMEARTEKVVNDAKSDLSPEEKAAIVRATKTVGRLALRSQAGPLDPGEAMMFKTALATVKRSESLALLIGKEVAVNMAAEFAEVAGATAKVFGRVLLSGLGIPLPLG